MSRGYVSTRWGQLHFVAEGEARSGGRTIVLLHETPVNAAAYGRLQPLLAERHRVVAFDTPGYGSSDPPPGLTTIEEYSTTFVEALDALGLGEVTLLGAHTGCCYAIELAARTAPARVQAIVLCGVPLYDNEVRAVKLASVPSLEPIEEDGSHFVKSWQSGPAMLDPERRTRTVTSLYEHPATAYSAYHAVFSYDTAAALALLRCPVLLASCEIDSLAPADERVVELVPWAERQRLEAALLPMYWTEAAELARRVLAWLDAQLVS